MGNDNSKLRKENTNIDLDNADKDGSSSVPAKSCKEHSNNQRYSPYCRQHSNQLILFTTASNKHRDSFELTAVHARRIHGPDECITSTLEDLSRHSAPVAVAQNLNATAQKLTPRILYNMAESDSSVGSLQVANPKKYPSRNLTGRDRLTHQNVSPKVYRYSELRDPDALFAGETIRSPSGKDLSVEQFRDYPARPMCIRERQENILQSVSRLALAEGHPEKQTDEVVNTIIRDGKALKKKTAVPNLQGAMSQCSDWPIHPGIRCKRQVTLRVDCAKEPETDKAGIKQSKSRRRIESQRQTKALRLSSSSVLCGDVPGIIKKSDARGIPYGNEAGCEYVGRADLDYPTCDGEGTENVCCNFFCGWDSPVIR